MRLLVCYLSLIGLCGTSSILADSWVGVSGSGMLSMKGNHANSCADGETPKGYSVGILGGMASKSFFIEGSVNYQKFIANKLDGFDRAANGSCVKPDKDYLYFNYRQEFISIFLLPGYRQKISESFSLLISAGPILLLNLGIKRDSVFLNNLADTTMDGTIQTNTKSLPLDGVEHKQTDTLVYLNLLYGIGGAGKISAAYTPPNSQFGIILHASLEKYYSINPSTSGLSLMTSPISDFFFRIGVDAIYRLY